MKSFLKIFITVLVFISFFQKADSQIPTYTLTAKNFIHLSPNSFTFEIILVHTDSNRFEYAGGQYFFNFNNQISNGGTLNYAIAEGVSSLDTSDFPVNMRPRNPMISGIQLRLSANSLPGAGNGTIIPQGIQWKVIKLRLSTSAFSFAAVNLDLQWRNAPIANPVTKINAYIGTTNTEITTTNTHSIEHISVNIKLAIEGLYNTSIGLQNKRDSITAYLRNPSPPYQIVDSAKSIIDSISLSGNFHFLNTNSTGVYYIVIKHKNSLETWSKSGGENLISGNNFYDFTTSASQAYGNNLVLKGNKYCIYSGNVNNDNIIDIDDLVQVDNDLYNYSPGSYITNLNGDDIVDIDDLALVDKNAKNLVLVEWPGLTTEMRKQILANKNKILY